MGNDYHILSTKNNNLFVIFMFEVLTNNNAVNFEQLGQDINTKRDIRNMTSYTRHNLNLGSV